MSVWSIPLEAFEDLPKPGGLVGFERVPVAHVVKAEQGLVLVEVEHRFQYAQPDVVKIVDDPRSIPPAPLPAAITGRGHYVGGGLWRFRCLGEPPHPGAVVYSTSDPEVVTGNPFTGGLAVGVAVAGVPADRAVYVRVEGTLEAVAYDEDAEDDPDSGCCNAGPGRYEAPLLDRIEDALESEVLDVEDAIALLEDASIAIRSIQSALG